MTTEQPARTVTSRDLWAAVHDLMAEPEPTGGNPNRQPSLWQVLLASVEPGQGEPGRGVQESRPPLNLAAESIQLEAEAAVKLYCWLALITMTGEFATDLRAVVYHITELGDPDVLLHWRRIVVSWCQRIRTTCCNDPDRPVRFYGRACKICTATWARVRSGDGGLVRVPAIVVTYQDGLWQEAECSACGATLQRGSAMWRVRPGRRVDNGH